MLHYTLCIYLNKSPKKIKYIVFNLHDYTNISEIINDFKECIHIAVGEDFKAQFSEINIKSQHIMKVLFSFVIKISTI